VNARVSYALATALALACALRILHEPALSAADIRDADISIREDFAIAVGRSPQPPIREIRTVLEEIAKRPGPIRSAAVWALCVHAKEPSTILVLRRVVRDDAATAVQRGSAAVALARVDPDDIETREAVDALVSAGDPTLRLFGNAAQRHPK
jgi:hypothetical protein